MCLCAWHDESFHPSDCPNSTKTLCSIGTRAEQFFLFCEGKSPARQKFQDLWILMKSCIVRLLGRAQCLTRQKLAHRRLFAQSDSPAIGGSSLFGSLHTSK
jgi:hypothetical protein